MDFRERVIPKVSTNYLIMEALSRYEFVYDNLEKGSRVLDVGCGTGYGSRLLASKTKVVGVDLDSEAIMYAREHYGKFVKFFKGDAENLKFKKGAFDAIINLETIEHLKRPEKFLTAAKKLLKTKGKIFLSTPNKLVHSPEKIESPYHEKEYTYDEFETLLKKYFLEVNLFGQQKSQHAKQALKDYYKSQKVRQSFVDSDTFGLRKLIPRNIKEQLWKHIGSFWGRSSQNELKSKDFPILRKNLKQAEYFVAICEK